MKTVVLYSQNHSYGFARLKFLLIVVVVKDVLSATGTNCRVETNLELLEVGFGLEHASWQ